MNEREQEGVSRSRASDDRESIWTIPTKLKRWYFALFSIQVVVAAVWLVITAVGDEARNGAKDILTFLWLNMAPAAVSSATFTLVIVDTVNGIMVLSTWLEETLEKRRQRQIEAAEERGLARGRAELRRRQMEWEQWNRRRETAAAAGGEFTEPPPSVIRETEDSD